MRARVLRLVSVACLAPAALLAGSLPAQAAAAPARVVVSGHDGAEVVHASGTFEAQLDPLTFGFEPVRSRCLVTVSGTLTFSGTLQGTAPATTAALEDASCAQVLANPPGTFADVFSSTGTFSGTVDGQPVTADLVYAGRTAPGGSIDAVMRFTGDVTGALHVEATLGVGGTYGGVLVVH